MSRYISGRYKKTPQSGLTSDRYRYLSPGDAEPNLGDTPSAQGSPNLPPGQQYIVVGFLDRPGERFWIPNQGGLIPGSISVFDEGDLVGGLSSTTQLDFQGNAIVVEGIQTPQPGVAVTITVSPPGDNNSVLFKNNDDFDADTRFTFDSGLLAAGDRITVGTGGTVITTTLGGLVGIGTTIPTQELHLNGDFRITGTIYDSQNQPGTPGDLLVKSEVGDLIWIRPEAVISGAGGTIGQIQFHNTAGLVDGADNFYFDYINNRVGIGSTQPTQLLDVLGVSTFSGGVNVDTLTAFENSTFKNNLTVDKKLIVDGLADLDELKVVGIATFNNKIEAKKDLDVDGHTELDNLGVSGIATFSGELQIADTGSLNVIGTSVGVAVTLAGNGGITTTGGDLYVGGDLFIKDDLTFDHLTANTGEFTQSLKVSGIFTSTSFADIDDIRITGNTIKSTGTGDNLVLQSDHGNVQINDDVYVNSDIESNDKDTGALVVNGGVGIEKNLNVGGAVSFTGPSSGIAVTLAAAGGITTTGGDLYVSGDLNVEDQLTFTDLSGENMVISGIATINQLEIGQPDQSLIGITTILDQDDMVSNSDTALATQQSIKAYVDNEIGAIDLDFSGDTGTGSVDLDDQTFAISGTTNEIETSASNQKLTIGLPDNVTVSGNLTVNGNTTLGDDATVDTVSFGSTISSSFIPNADNTYNIGSTNYKWSTVYATTFNGAFQGNADTADRLKTPKTFTLGEGENDDIVSVGKTFDGSADVGFALTLTNTNVTAGDYGSSSKVGTFSVDAKGRLTAAADVDIAFATASVAIAGYAHTAGIATIAGYAHTAGIATHLKGGQAYNIPYQSGADTTQFISNGSDGQLLKYNDNAAPSWISAGDISAGIAQTANNLAGGAVGSIPYQSGADTTTFLGEPDADGYILHYNNSGDAPEWKELSTFGGVGYALSAVDSGNNVKLTLSDGTTNDDVLITAGSNISIDTVTEGGFTIDAVKGAGVSIASSASDVLNANGGEIGGVGAGDDKIVFYDFSTSKLTYLTAGTGLTIDDTTINVDSDVGNTYDLTVEQTAGNNDDPAIRLSDGTTNDDITITGGSNITVTRNSATQLTISAAAGAGIGVDASADDILSVTNGNIAADNANADKIVFYNFDHDTGNGKLTYLTVGTGLSITDTTITGKSYSQEVGEESGNTGNINLRLKDDAEGTFDDILVTAGAGVTFSSISADGFTIEVDTDSGDIALDKISEGNSKAEIIDTATESKLTVVIDNAEKFSVDSASSKIHRQDTSNEGGSLVFNRANDDTAAFEIDVYGSSNTDSGRFRIIDATSTTERFEIGPNGEIGLSGANYGSAGQVLTSGGSGSAVTWQTVSGSGGGTGNGTLIDVEVKQFSDNNTPRTEYACTNPIDVDVDATSGIATIGIGTVSNAYGKRYIGPTEPTQDVCDGDIWYDTSTGGGDAAFTSDPVGTIVAWSGTVANIPTGYQLCDGTGVLSVELQAIVGANVPDLRSRFIVGASDVSGTGSWPSVGVGSTGGSANAVVAAHTHPDDFSINGQVNTLYRSTTNVADNIPGEANNTAYYTPTLTGSVLDGGLDADGNVNNTQSGTNANLPPYYALCYIIKYGASNTTISGVVDKISEGNTEAEVVDTGSDGHFKVSTEGTERLRIDHNGNVGIGTTTPIARLDVRGGIVIDPLFDSLDMDESGEVSSLDAGKFDKGEFPSTPSIENSQGNAGLHFIRGAIQEVVVGIPQYSGGFALFGRNSTYDNADNFITAQPSKGIRIAYSNGTFELLKTALYGNGLPTPILKIEPNDDNLLFDGGNVGIGFTVTASEQPTAKLHVKGTVAIGSSVYDSNGNTGSEGQVLSSVPGIGVSWTNQTGGSGGGGEPVGSIIAWSGTVANIPTGYQLCDGTAADTPELAAITGTNVPDLRSRFIVGASDVSGTGSWPSVGVGSTGGNANAVLIAHNHTISPTTVLSSANGGQTILQGAPSGTALDYGTNTGSDIVGQTNTGANSTSQTGTNANLPPYYALCYIIKHTATASSGSGSGSGSGFVLLPAQTIDPAAQQSSNAVEFTGIPADALEITLMFEGVSGSTNGEIDVQLGTSSGYITSNYDSLSEIPQGNQVESASTTSFRILSNASDSLHGSMIINKSSSNSYTQIGQFKQSDTSACDCYGSLSSVSGVVDRLKVSADRSINNTSYLDAGKISLSYKTASSGGSSSSGSSNYNSSILSANGTNELEFTDIPSWATKVTLIAENVLLPQPSANSVGSLLEFGGPSGYLAPNSYAYNLHYGTLDTNNSFTSSLSDIGIFNNTPYADFIVLYGSGSHQNNPILSQVFITFQKVKGQDKWVFEGSASNRQGDPSTTTIDQKWLNRFAGSFTSTEAITKLKFYTYDTPNSTNGFPAGNVNYTGGSVTAIYEGEGSSTPAANTVSSDAIVLQTAKSAATGTSDPIEFTDIPEDAYEITLMFNGVSLSGSEHYFIQLGTSSGYIETGYEATTKSEGAGSDVSSNAAFIVFNSTGGSLHLGKFDINKFSDTAYTFEGQARRGINSGTQAYGSLNGVNGAITRLRIKPSGGTNNFTGGSFNISYKTPGSANNEGTDAGQGFFENDTTLNSSKTLPANKNVGIFGPYTIGNNVTLTVPTGTTFTVV